MGIFRRVADIVTANVHDLVDRFEDPERMLKLSIREIEDAIEETMDRAAKVVGTERTLASQLESQRREAKEWRERAIDFVSQSQDEKARKAIERRIECESVANAIEDQLESLLQSSGKLRRQIEAMHAKLAEARRLSLSLAAQRNAVHARKLSTGKIPQTSRGFDAIDKISRKLELAEAEADARQEWNDQFSGRSELAASRNHAIDQELKLLKEKQD